jgi:hypothetical protein
VEIPTVNGYSGRNPPGYGSLFENVIRSGEDRQRLRADLAAWRARHDLGADAICAIETVAPY